GSGATGLGDAPRPGRRKAELVLTDAGREQLTRWARRAKTSQVLALRAKIVLACADGRENKAVAAQLRTSEHNVARWRGRFPGGAAPGRDALVTGVDGQAQRRVGVHRRADLAQVRAEAAPDRRLQAQHRPAVHREGR